MTIECLEEGAGLATLDQGLGTKSCILRLKSPVKLYGGQALTATTVARASHNRRVATAETRAACAALAARREMQKTVRACEQTKVQPQENYSIDHLNNVKGRCQANTGGILQPRNASLPPCNSMDRAHNVAVLAMQHRMSELCQEVEFNRELIVQGKQLLAQAEADHAQKLKEAEEAACAKIGSMQHQLAEQHLQQRRWRLLATSSKAWVNWAKQRKQQSLGRQQQRVQLQHTCLEAWRAQMHVTRETRIDVQRQQALVLHSWQDYVYAVASIQHKIHKVQQMRLTHILAGWLKWMLHKQQALQKVQQAQWWRRRRMLSISFSRWSSALLIRMVKAHDMAHRQLRKRAKEAVKAWLQAATASRPQPQRTETLPEPEDQPPHVVLQSTLVHWQQYINQKVQGSYLQHRYQQVILRRAWRLWAQLPAVSRRLRHIEAALAPVGIQVLKQWGWLGFKQHTWEGRARQELQQMGLCRKLCAWRRLAVKKAKNRRLLQARASYQRLQVLTRCFLWWCRCSAKAAIMTVAAKATEAQEMLAQQTARSNNAEAQAASATEQLQLLLKHNQQLQQEVIAAGAGAASGLQFAPALCWHSLPFDPHVPSLQARARHAVFHVPVLQQPASRLPQGPGGVAGGLHAGLHLDVLLVYGGVRGDTWLTDLNMLLIQQTQGGDCRMTVLAVPSSGASGDESRVDHAAQQIDGRTLHGSPASNQGFGPAEYTQLPQAVRDFAACACGHNQFIVSGGFGGNLDTLQLQLCVLEHKMQQTGVLSKQESEEQPTSDDADPDIIDWCQGWSARWRLLQSHNRGPVGRCHHSICYYAAGRSLVVFGGWANRQGCLNDVWLFHQDHNEWWQPEAKGDVPGQRRSHAAVIVGHNLFVYGGLDSEGHHLGDLWCLNMHKWVWQQAVSRDGVQPPSRRAAALELVDSRYLLLHGGYSGSQQLLQDTWVFDTISNRWLAVDVAAPASELPVPRALHTLTSLGHRFVVIGGVGPAGPVPDVHLLECPAVTRGLQLQQQHLDSQCQLVYSRQRSAQLYADLVSSRTQVQESQRQLQVLSATLTEVHGQYAATTQHLNSLQTRLLSAQQAVSATAQQAHAAQQNVAVLERRLARARQGGNRAVEAAKQTSKQLQEAEQIILHLRQQLQDHQRLLHQQQLSLSERKAEVVALQFELQDCKMHMHLANAAKDNVHTDLTAALQRRDNLHAQELQHMHSLLQDARQAQRTLADKLPALQAQPVIPAALIPPATTSDDAASTTSGTTDAPAAASGSNCELKCEVAISQKMSTADVCGEAGRDGVRISASNSAAVAVSGGKNAAAVARGTGSSVELTADEVSVLDSTQGNMQEQLVNLQQKTRLQEEEIILMKQQLHLQQAAAVAAQQSQQAAVQSLQQLEQHYDQQVLALERQVQSYRWQQWSTADTAAAQGADSSDTELGAPVNSQRTPACDCRQWNAEYLAANNAFVAGDVAKQPMHHDEQQQLPVAQNSSTPLGDATANSGAVPEVGRCRNTVSNMAGGVSHTAVEQGPCKPDFTVSLLASEPVDGELELLPEVVKLLELHRELMAGY